MQRESIAKNAGLTTGVQRTWFEEDTVDYWRHYRMIAPLKPLLDYYKKTKWVTIGDGRYGLDSIKLKRVQPELEILPTDIAPELLKEAKEKNIIDDYRAENAEALSFGDEAFDFSFCKEAYHHFPRPYIALYEMLRVSSKGVVLIEPNEKKDKMIPERIKNVINHSVKKLLGKTIHHPETWSFEVSGNFIYSVSKNEIEKIALGMQLPSVAFYYYNDYYEEGVEFQKATHDNPLFRKVKRMIARDNIICSLGLQTYSSIIVILFKQSPDTELRGTLKHGGFTIVDLPVNPYLKKWEETL